jgi:hypothetical protein
MGRERDPAPAPATFFICYRREDAGYAAALSRALAERHGADRVFKDITSLALAQDWRAEVAAAIGRSTHVLTLVGPSWMVGVDASGRRNGRPDPVAFELAEAFRLGRTVVPVLLGGYGIPPAHRLPQALQRLPDLNAAYIRTESADADIAHLVDRLSPRSNRTAHPQDARPRPPQGRSGAGRLVGSLAALAVVGALVWAGVTVWDKLPGLSTALPGDATPVLTISPDRGRLGSTVTATATGFSPGATVRFIFHASPVADAVADGDGRVTATFTVPQTYFAGTTYDVTAVEERSATRDSALFTVT